MTIRLAYPFSCVLVIAFSATEMQAQTSPPADTISALQIAELYENLGEFVKAEEQFVASAQTLDPKLRQLALEGIRRVRGRLRQVNGIAALAAAKEYELLHRWEQARDEYASAAKAATGNVLEDAIAGMRRADRQLWRKRAAALFDAALLWLGRSLAVLLLVFWLPRTCWSMWTGRRSIKIYPFLAHNDDAARRVAFWLAHARASLRAERTRPSDADLLVAWSSSLPYIDMPDLPSDIIEVGDLELGETKLPLKDLVTALNRPKVRVSGGWTCATIGGQAYAEIEQRGWFRYSVHSTVMRQLATAEAAQASDLEVFGYDVLIHAVDAHEA